MLFAGYRTDTGITSNLYMDHILPILKFYFHVGVFQKCMVTAQYYSLFLLCKWYIFINFAKKTYQSVSFLCILHSIPTNGYFAKFPFILCLKNYEKS